MDARDAILYSTCPLEPAPTLGAFQPLEVSGRRLLAARDGLYLEARSPALHWLLRVAPLPMPYGPLQPFLRLANGPVPMATLYEIANRSRQASPSEIAFGVQAQDEGYELLQPVQISASAGHVTYQDSFDADRLVLDVHSHGRGEAYFSGTDDASDLSRIGPYIAAVIAPRETYGATRMVFRAVCSPYLIPIDFSDAIFKDLIA